MPASHEPLPPGRDAGRGDRLLAALVVAAFAIAALAYSPAQPNPSGVKRHVAALAGLAAIAVAAFGAARGRGFPVPPLPLATLGIVAAMGLTAVIPATLSNVYSPGRAFLATASALGLVILSGAARSAARAHLGAAMLSACTAAGAVVAAIGLAESFGLDVLGAAPLYDSKANPVSTFGNPDLVAELLAPTVSVAIALACARGGIARVLFLAAAALGTACLGRIGVRFGYVALGVGAIAAAGFTLARVRRAGGDVRATLGSLGLALAVMALALASGRLLAPRGEAAASAPAGGSLPPSLEVRVRVTAAATKLALAMAPFGCGAGNFAIAFPFQRDHDEIELSTHRRTTGAETVVDVAHNDPLQLVAETGAVGLLALAALAAGLVGWWRRGLLSSTPNAVAAAAALAALVVAAVGRSPFYDNAATALLGAIALGVAGAADGRHPERTSGNAGRAIGLCVLAAIPYPAVVAYSALEADAMVAREAVDPQRGAERLVRAAAFAPYDEQIPLRLARRLRAEGDVVLALTAYDEALRRHPALVEALLNRGALLAEAGRVAEARADFEACRILDPNNPALRFNRALLAHAQGKDAEAAMLLEDATDGKNDDTTMRRWGAALFEREEYARALPYLDRWVARQPDDADAWFQLGMIFLKQGDRAAADLDLARAHALYALEHLRAGRLESAERSIRLYRGKAAPSDAGPWVLEAVLALARGDEAAAAAAIDRAENERTRLPPGFLAKPELAALRAHATLGPRVKRFGE